MTDIVKFDYTYNDQAITFEFQNQNVMVNATEMAKVFGKEIKDFMRNEGTKNFIEACLKTENSPFLNVEKEEDLVISKQRTGTWMHRILALKFAAWLNPDFEVWVYSTIDHILFGNYKRMEESLRESAERKNRLQELATLLLDDPNFLEYQQLQIEERQAARRRGKHNRNQMDLFQEMMRNN